MFLVGYKSCSTDSYNNLHLLEGDATLVALYICHCFALISMYTVPQVSWT